VIADGTFSQAWQRELLSGVAERSGAFRFFLELTASPSQIRERLERRRGDLSAVSDADWSIHLAQTARWEPITLPDWDHPVISTESGVQDVVRRANEQLSLRLDPAHPRSEPSTDDTP
jgi:predicted kinase